MLIEYNNVQLEVFDQLVVGRLRLYSGAVPDQLNRVVELWQQNKLGQHFLVKPMTSQPIGEEVFDGNRLIGVFGLAVTNAFAPNEEIYKKYRTTVDKVIQSL